MVRIPHTGTHLRRTLDPSSLDTFSVNRCPTTGALSTASVSLNRVKRRNVGCLVLGFIYESDCRSGHLSGTSRSVGWKESHGRISFRTQVEVVDYPHLFCPRDGSPSNLSLLMVIFNFRSNLGMFS